MLLDSFNPWVSTRRVTNAPIFLWSQNESHSWHTSKENVIALHPAHQPVDQLHSCSVQPRVLLVDVTTKRTDVASGKLGNLTRRSALFGRVFGDSKSHAGRGRKGTRQWAKTKAKIPAFAQGVSCSQKPLYCSWGVCTLLAAVARHKLRHALLPDVLHSCVAQGLRNPAVPRQLVSKPYNICLPLERHERCFSEHT